MSLFKNRYRIESRRLKGWDYRFPAQYFVTICVCGKKELFGDVKNGVVSLSVPGEAASQMWLQIPEHHKNVILDEFVVMPHHVHGIIEICNDPVSDVVHNVATKINTKTMSDISPKKGSLGAIVRSYKSAVTNWCHSNNYPDFAWQGRFYDHIIRNEQELDRIRTYIQENSTRWEIDKNSSSGLAEWYD